MVGSGRQVGSPEVKRGDRPYITVNAPLPVGYHILLFSRRGSLLLRPRHASLASSSAAGRVLGGASYCAAAVHRAVKKRAEADVYEPGWQRDLGHGLASVEAPSPISVGLGGSVLSIKDVHASKADRPILVRVGRQRGKDEQPEKAPTTSSGFDHGDCGRQRHLRQARANPERRPRRFAMVPAGGHIERPKNPGSGGSSSAHCARCRGMQTSPNTQFRRS